MTEIRQKSEKAGSKVIDNIETFFGEKLDLGSSRETYRGSNPLSRTKSFYLRFLVNLKGAEK